MIRKTLALALATILTASMFIVKTTAKTNNISNALKRLERFEDKPISPEYDKNISLADTIKSGDFTDVVLHEETDKQVSTFTANNSSLRQGNLNNIVVNVRFNGEGEFLTTEKNGQPIAEIFNNLYNESNLSVREYYKTLSNNKLNVETSFIGNNTTESIELDHTRGYYRPYSRNNKEGYFQYILLNSQTGEFLANLYYDSVDTDLDPSDGVVTSEYLNQNNSVVLIRTTIYSTYRELTLVDEISKKVNDSGILNLNLDKDGNNMIDALTIMVGLADSEGLAHDLSWAELLWPHQTSVIRDITAEDVESLKSIANVDFSFALGAQYKLADKFIDKYNLYTSDFILLDGLQVNSDKGNIGAVGTVCHELAHILEFPDFYNYLNQWDSCVGQWDLMANTGLIPQYVNSYLRKEAGWLTDTEMPVVESDGEYELKPVSSTTEGEISGYIIKLPEYPEQSFFVEYRKSEGVFEGGQATIDGYPYPIISIKPEDSGLIIYRVDNSVENSYQMLMAGNFFGYPYNLYVFRPNSDNTDVDNSNAALTGLSKTIFGSINSNEILNAITFQGGLDGSGNPKLVNSKIVINNVTLNEKNNSIRFTIDAKDPTIIKAEIIDNKIVVQFDERISSDSNLNLIKLITGVTEKEISSKIVDNNKIEISLASGNLNGQYNLVIPKEAIKDIVGKTLNKDYSQNIKISDNVNIETITLDKNEAILIAGGQLKLTATITPENATNKGIIWSSSDESIATVAVAPVKIDNSQNRNKIVNELPKTGTENYSLVFGLSLLVAGILIRFKTSKLKV